MRPWLLVCAGLTFAGLATAGQPDPAKQGKGGNEAERGEGVSVTIYNQNFVVVNERRLMDLKQGRSTLRFRDVAATIVPETVHFKALRQPDAARVVEQSYEFDLVNADKLLDRYLERDISLVTQDGLLLKGRLLSFDAQQLILQTPGG